MEQAEINYVHDVYPVEYGEALHHLFRRFNVCGDAILKTSLCIRFQQICDPVLSKLEGVFGFGGNLNAGKSSRRGHKSDNLDLNVGSILEDG